VTLASSIFEVVRARPGWCLEPHDLAVSKLAAGREEDFDFVGALGDAGLLDLEVVRARLAVVPRDRALPAFLAKAERWLRARAVSR
jgi:hypothetical protein